MAPRISEATGKMTQLCRKVVHFKIRWNLLEKVSAFRELFKFIRDRVLDCYIGKKPVRYGRLSNPRSSSPAAPPESDFVDDPEAAETCSGFESDSDLVNLKISLLGNSQIGKTTFLTKYVEDKQVKKSLQMKGLNLMDKVCSVKGARIVFRIWDVGGDQRSFDQVPLACKDAVAVLFMFDLTSRSTLHSVTGWYNEARKWNKTAIPVLIGTKFDDFAKLPPDIQSTVVNEARSYARAMKAALFFSSATHNINVNKIFKFIMAELFNLPWTVERNLRIGEPIIDF